MGMTMTQKILAAHAGLDSVTAGQLIEAKLDVVMANDITGPMALPIFRQMADKVFDKDKVVLVPDHFTPNKDIKSAENSKAIREFAKDQGLSWYFEQGKSGVEHAILPEAGVVTAGECIIGADSHTCTYGALGAFSTGVGTTDISTGMATGELWFKVPEAIKIVLNGHLRDGVMSKDVILRILGDIKADGGQYKSLEFTGPAAHEMSMEQRFTVANMALEAGAKCGLFEADEKTAEYYGMPLEDIDWVCVDDEAKYEKVLTYDVSELEPQLSCPQGVDNVHPISEVKGTKMDEVYLGSCTNGSIEDMEAAAKILKGRKVAKGLRFIVVPATNTIFKQAIERGYIKTFIEAGAVICHPCCGLCCGMPYGLMTDDERILLTANRNFIGRQGTKKTLGYLSSPTVAAATAVMGVVTDPADLPALA